MAEPQRTEIVGPVDVHHVNGEIRRISRAERLKGLGIFLLGVSAVITSIVAWTALQQAADLRHEQECRFEISAEVNEVNERINAITGEIFVAAIADDDARAQELGMELDTQLHALEPAIERRNEAVATCNQS
jgi:hypothetical protein